MARQHQIYWYREDKHVAAAALWHVRDQDLTTGGGITRGAIVQGHYGVAVAECDVPALSGCIVAFQATPPHPSDKKARARGPAPRSRS